MPILAIDSMGRIYEASPDRADGLGYKTHAQPVTNGDVTLGNVYLKEACRYRDDVLKEKRAMAIEELKDRRVRLERKKAIAEQRRKAMLEDELARNEIYQRNRAREAIQMGCNCSVPSTTLSGDGRTANGQRGWNGMDRDQQTIHHAIAGMGHNTAHGANRLEVAQRNFEKQALRRIGHEAAQRTARNEIEHRKNVQQRKVEQARVNYANGNSRGLLNNPYRHIMKGSFR